MSEFEKAKERAHQRASVLTNLQKSHTKKNEQQAAIKQEIPVLSQSASTAAATDIVLSVIGDSSFKSKKFISDALNGKQILLDNIKAPADIVKNDIRAKMQVEDTTMTMHNFSNFVYSLCRQSKRKKVISNKKLKKLGLCDPLFRPCNEDVEALHDFWWTYIKDVMRVCGSEPQLQAR